MSVFEQYLPKTTPPTEVQTTEMTQRESAPPLRMAEVNEMSEISPDGHDEMPFRLGDIVLEKKFADLHPMLSTVDQIRHEWKFQFKLLRH